MNKDTKQFLDAIKDAIDGGFENVQWHGPIPEEIREWLKLENSKVYFKIFGVMIKVEPIYILRKQSEIKTN